MTGVQTCALPILGRKVAVGDFFFTKSCKIEPFVLTLRYKDKARELSFPKKILTFHHIKVDWETHQILMKYRDKLRRLMAGPILARGGLISPGGLQRAAGTQILSFGVSSHPLMWPP